LIGHALTFAMFVIALLIFSVVSTVGCIIAILWFTARTLRNAYLVATARSPFSLTLKSLLISLLFLGDFWLVGILLFSIDAEAIPNDYTVTDLRSAEAQFAQSYGILNGLHQAGDTLENRYATIAASKQDMNDIAAVIEILHNGNHEDLRNALRAHASTITRRWERALEAEDIITKLNTFPQVADLSEPIFNPRLGPLAELIGLSRTYIAYACLQTEDGASELGAAILIEFDSVIRKLSVNARHLATKLVCFRILFRDIEAATFIVQHQQTSKEASLALAEHFVPLSSQQLSLRNVIITEYLRFKDALKSLPVIGKRPYLKNLPFLKRNSSIRVCRNWYDDLIEKYEGCQTTPTNRFSAWPKVYPDLGPVVIDPNGRLPWFYERYNKVGSTILKIFMVNFGRFAETRRELQICDDLLQIAIGKRLEHNNANHYPNKCGIDLIYSRVANLRIDRQTNSHDDARLSLDPDTHGISMK